MYPKWQWHIQRWTCLQKLYFVTVTLCSCFIWYQVCTLCSKYVGMHIIIISMHQTVTFLLFTIGCAKWQSGHATVSPHFSCDWWWLAWHYWGENLLDITRGESSAEYPTFVSLKSLGAFVKVHWGVSFTMIVRDEPKLPDILGKICTSLSSPLFSLFSTLFSVTRRAQAVWHSLEIW